MRLASRAFNQGAATGLSSKLTGRYDQAEHLLVSQIKMCRNKPRRCFLEHRFLLTGVKPSYVRNGLADCQFTIGVEHTSEVQTFLI